LKNCQNTISKSDNVQVFRITPGEKVTRSTKSVT